MLPAKFSYEFLQDTSEEDLYEKLIVQLNKDFYLASLSYRFQEQLSVEELVHSLSEIITELFTKDYDGYLNFLYRVDVAEKDLARIRTTNSTEAISQVVFLILKREYQKVWFKNKF